MSRFRNWGKVNGATYHTRLKICNNHIWLNYTFLEYHCMIFFLYEVLYFPAFIFRWKLASYARHEPRRPEKPAPDHVHLRRLPSRGIPGSSTRVQLAQTVKVLRADNVKSRGKTSPLISHHFLENRRSSPPPGSSVTRYAARLTHTAAPMMSSRNERRRRKSQEAKGTFFFCGHQRVRRGPREWAGEKRSHHDRQQSSLISCRSVSVIQEK